MKGRKKSTHLRYRGTKDQYMDKCDEEHQDVILCSEEFIDKEIRRCRSGISYFYKREMYIETFVNDYKKEYELPLC